jgi:hypothetical protein
MPARAQRCSASGEAFDVRNSAEIVDAIFAAPAADAARLSFPTPET